MTYLVSYQKHIDSITIKQLNLHAPGSTEAVGQEIATVDGTTYVAMPDGSTLPENQPTEIAISIINPVVVTAALREQIKLNSPQCKLISSRMVEKIREKYSLEDEQYFARIGVGVALGAYTFQPGEQEALLAFGTFIESIRQWGKSERSNLGL